MSEKTLKEKSLLVDIKKKEYVKELKSKLRDSEMRHYLVLSKIEDTKQKVKRKLIY